MYKQAYRILTICRIFKQKHFCAPEGIYAIHISSFIKIKNGDANLLLFADLKWNDPSIS